MLSDAGGVLHSDHWRELAKYCVVGVVGNAINLAVYDVLLNNGIDYRLAATIAFPMAVGANYALNRYWTFRDRRAGITSQGARFFAVALGALGVNILLLDLLIRVVGIDELLAQAIAIVILTPFNFTANKLWSFGVPTT